MRHQNKDNHSVGALFRQVTLASVGLESLDALSAQSVTLFDKADKLASRLTERTERLFRFGESGEDNHYKGMDIFSPVLADEIEGARGTTDLHAWQYWLDAVLLMLFDEGEEDVAERYEQLRANVGRIAKSGADPRKFAKLSVEEKRAVILGDSPVPESVKQAKRTGGMARAAQETETVFAKSLALAETNGSDKGRFDTFVASRAEGRKALAKWHRQWKAIAGQDVVDVETLSAARASLIRMRESGIIGPGEMAMFETFGRRLEEKTAEAGKAALSAWHGAVSRYEQSGTHTDEMTAALTGLRRAKILGAADVENIRRMIEKKADVSLLNGALSERMSGTMSLRAPLSEKTRAVTESLSYFESVLDRYESDFAAAGDETMVHVRSESERPASDSWDLPTVWISEPARRQLTEMMRSGEKPETVRETANRALEESGYYADSVRQAHEIIKLRNRALEKGMSREAFSEALSSAGTFLGEESLKKLIESVYGGKGNFNAILEDSLAVEDISSMLGTADASEFTKRALRLEQIGILPAGANRRLNIAFRGQSEERSFKAALKSEMKRSAKGLSFNASEVRKIGAMFEKFGAMRKKLSPSGHLSKIFGVGAEKLLSVLERGESVASLWTEGASVAGADKLTEVVDWLNEKITSFEKSGANYPSRAMREALAGGDFESLRFMLGSMAAEKFEPEYGDFESHFMAHLNFSETGDYFETSRRGTEASYRGLTIEPTSHRSFEVAQVSRASSDKLASRLEILRVLSRREESAEQMRAQRLLARFERRIMQGATNEALTESIMSATERYESYDIDTGKKYIRLGETAVNGDYYTALSSDLAQLKKVVRKYESRPSDSYAVPSAKAKSHSMLSLLSGHEEKRSSIIGNSFELGDLHPNLSKLEMLRTSLSEYGLKLNFAAPERVLEAFLRDWTEGRTRFESISHLNSAIAERIVAVADEEKFEKYAGSFGEETTRIHYKSLNASTGDSVSVEISGAGTDMYRLKTPIGNKGREEQTFALRLDVKKHMLDPMRDAFLTQILNTDRHTLRVSENYRKATGDYASYGEIASKSTLRLNMHDLFRTTLGAEAFERYVAGTAGSAGYEDFGEISRDVIQQKSVGFEDARDVIRDRIPELSAKLQDVNKVIRKMSERAINARLKANKAYFSDFVPTGFGASSFKELLYVLSEENGHADNRYHGVKDLSSYASNAHLRDLVKPFRERLAETAAGGKFFYPGAYADNAVLFTPSGDKYRAGRMIADDEKFRSDVSSNRYDDAFFKMDLIEAEKDNNIEEAAMLRRIDGALDQAQEVVQNKVVSMIAENAGVLQLFERASEAEAGVPIWKRKDKNELIAGMTHKEMQDIMRKLGVTQIQGIQAAQEKQFINPFVAPKEEVENAYAPLFSEGDGGTIPGSAPKTLADMRSNMDNANNVTLSYEDLMTIADEIYDRIIDSVREVINRRRGE